MIARVLRGGDCAEDGIFTRQADAHWALGLSKGLTSPAPKLDPNEDACGVVTGGVGAVAVVADAHFGRLSAELVVDHLLNMALNEPPPRAAAAEVWGWLEEHLQTANRRVRAHNSRSACALVALVVQGKALRWASVGDCRLYHVTTQTGTILNPIDNIYLGDLDEVLPRFGEVTLTAGDRVVLASDGLPECRYGKRTLTPTQIADVVRDTPPTNAVHDLIQMAFDHGGEDNIAVVVGEV